MNATNDTADNITHVLDTLVWNINLYYTPLLVALGSIGNSVSMVVFFSTKLRKLSSSVYLAALAVSDTGYLMVLLLAWLVWLDVPVFDPPGMCSLFNYMSYVCSFLSSWLVVAFTVERFVAVRYPLRRPSMCTVARAKAVLVGLTLLALTAFFPFTLITRPERTEEMPVMVCKMIEAWTPFGSFLNYVDTVVTFLLPFLVISVLNASICQTVWRLARVRRSMTLLERGATLSVAVEVRRGSTVRHRMRSTSSQTKVTKMLLVVSTVFLCCNLPAYLMRVLTFVKTVEDPSNEKEFITIQHLLNNLFNTNFGINFALYCVSGQNFRRSLVFMCCPRMRRRRETPQVTVVSECLRSTGSIGRRRTVTLNGFPVAGSWKDAHELLPLTQ